MDWRRKLLRIDCTAGAVVGLAMLALRGWLVEWYRLPGDLLLLMALMNLAYASYSFSLARRASRPMALIKLLVAANLAWALACVRWAFVHGGTASFFGLGQLVLEALFVGGLAILEWRWRELLRTR